MDVCSHNDDVLSASHRFIPLQQPSGAENNQNLPKDLAEALLFDTRSTLNRTVLDSGLHWPTPRQT
jgi:hypothetical protein